MTDIAARFPSIAAALAPYTYRDRLNREKLIERFPGFEKAVAALEAGIAAKEIANPVFIDAKATIASAVEKGWDKLSNEQPRFETVGDPVQTFIWNLSNPLGGVPAFVRANQKKLAKAPAHPYLTQVAGYIAEIAPLADLIEGAKAVVKKRQPKPVEDRKAKYNAPGASQTAIGRVKALLEEVTQGSHAELKDYFLKVFQGEMAAYLKAQAAANAENKTLSPYDMFCGRNAKYANSAAYSRVAAATTSESIRRMVTRDGKETAVYQTIHTAKPEADALFAAEAETIATEIRDNFVYKNLAKLDSIVDAKADLVQGEIIGRDISLGGLHGTLRFTFADGAHFTVQNAVVWSTSVHGLQFQRFPLTFHNVVLADGVKMGRPSEERMNDIFARGKANV